MKIALIHDYLREYGGAERVVEALHEIWPTSPLYTAFVDWQALGKFGDRFKTWEIRTTWADNWLMKKWHSPLRFLTPLVWESLNLDDYEVVISSSGWYICRSIVTGIGTLHISYIHHPPRNLYGLPTGSSTNSLIKAYATLINPFLRKYDYVTAQRPDYLIANSQITRQRINKLYKREAKVIYPPVAINSHQSSISSKRKYFLCVGRLNFAKRIDLAIAACNRLHLPLKIVGTGREERRLRQMAGSTIEFVSTVSDEELVKLYSSAKALIFTALEEDFGLVPVEAMSCGTPVIALRQGGPTETVLDGKTGVFFDQPTVESLVGAIEKFNQIYKINDFYKACIAQAQKFSKEKFKKQFKKLVEEKYLQFKSTK